MCASVKPFLKEKLVVLYYIKDCVLNIIFQQANVEKQKNKSAKVKENLERENEECMKKKDEEIKYLNEKVYNEEASRSHVTKELESYHSQMVKLEEENNKLEQEKITITETRKRVEGQNADLVKKLNTYVENHNASEQSYIQKVDEYAFYSAYMVV